MGSPRAVSEELNLRHRRWSALYDIAHVLIKDHSLKKKKRVGGEEQNKRINYLIETQHDDLKDGRGRSRENNGENEADSTQSTMRNECIIVMTRERVTPLTGRKEAASCRQDKTSSHDVHSSARQHQIACA